MLFGCAWAGACCAIEPPPPPARFAAGTRGWGPLAHATGWPGSGLAGRSGHGPSLGSVHVSARSESLHGPSLGSGMSRLPWLSPLSMPVAVVGLMLTAQGQFTSGPCAFVGAPDPYAPGERSIDA